MKSNDYTNKKFGLLTVKKFDTAQNKWDCECECGNHIFYTSRQLQSNKPKSCGCLKSPNIINKKYGLLTVKEKTTHSDANGNIFYLCECECGNTKEVTAHDLNCGQVKSCGCLYSTSLSEGGKIGGTINKEKYCIDGTIVTQLTAKLSKANTSGVKGVSWDKSKNKWTAQIRFKNKNYFLGRYENILDAKKAREQAEENLFGEFLKWYESTKDKNIDNKIDK